MNEIVPMGLVLGGSVFMLLAGLGAMRMPDFYMRLSTVTKGGTLGVFLVLAGVLWELFTLTVLIKVVAVLVFGFMTSPVAAHVVGRAAYFQGVSLWEGTQVDELKGQYEMRRHRLSSPDTEETFASAILSHDGSEQSPEKPEDDLSSRG